MKVKELIYNLHEADKKWIKLIVGVNGVKSIEEHQAQGEGDKWNYFVEFNDGHFLRIFHPILVEYFAESF